MLLSQILNPSLVGTEVMPTETALSKSSNRSPRANRSVMVTTPGPVNVQGGLLVISATGLTVGTHPPPQLVTADVARPKMNSCQLPSGVIGELCSGELKLANTARHANTHRYLILPPLRSTR